MQDEAAFSSSSFLYHPCHIFIALHKIHADCLPNMRRSNKASADTCQHEFVKVLEQVILNQKPDPPETR